VWIEIKDGNVDVMQALVTTLRWCGLKLSEYRAEIGLDSHHLAVVWIEIFVSSLLASSALLPPCGGVD